MTIPKAMKARTGFTIVEATIAIGIVGILVAASTGTFGAIARNRRIEIERRQAYLLGQSLMTEIMQCTFQDSGSTPVFGPEAGETRATFDDVDDYDGYSQAVPTARDGTVLSGYSGWTRSVAVAYVAVNNPASTVANSTLKQITVTVISPSNKRYTLVGLRSQLGAYEQAPGSQMTYITGVSVALQGASPSKTIYAGAHPLNIKTSQP